jgi:hypothetical protein
MMCKLDCRNCEAKNPADCDSRRKRDSVVTGLSALAILLGTLAAALAFAGCASESAKIVEGTDLSVGFTIPGDEGEANFTVFNYLSGFKTTTAESSRVKLTFTCAESNDYFGVITTRVNKRVDAEIWPVLDEADNDDDGEESKENEEPTISGTGEDRAPPH